MINYELLKKVSLLYVEDNEVIRDSLVEFLEEYFLTFYVAKDGEEGLEIFKNNAENIDIVVTDIKMPKLNGLEMSKEIKKISPETPIIITTAFNDSEYFMKSIDIKIDKYITKPVDILFLEEAIYESCDILFKKKELEEQYKLIEFMLDSNPNFMFTIKDKKINYINKTFLFYLGFDSLKEFKDSNAFISNSIIDNKLSESEWIDYITSSKNQKIFYLNNLNSDRESYKLVCNCFSNINTYLFTLNNITKLQKEKDKFKEKSLMQEKMLEIQSRQAEMGEMIDSIAHQWKQPLNIISGYNINLEMDIELNDLNIKNIKDCIKSTQTQIKFMSQTIDDFRNFFKPNKINQNFDVKKSIEDTKKLIFSQLKKLNINILIEGESFKINKIKNEFQQVILNILNNAKDALVLKQKEDKNFTPKIEINVDDDKKIVEIRDNAGGIPKHLIDKIFEPYFSTKIDKGGTGIGLYISKTIIENMGYVLKVENSNDGAIFTIGLN